MSADAIHAIGLTEVARIREDMERTRSDIGFAGDLPAFFDHIRTDPRFYYREPAELIRHFTAIEQKIWQGMPRRAGWSALMEPTGERRNHPRSRV